DKATGNTLVKGELNDGLYRLEGATTVRNGESKGKQLVNINNTAAFTLTGISVNVASRAVWHQRLGHPSSKVLNYILRGCNLSPKSNEEMFFFVIHVKWGSLMLFHFPNLCRTPLIFLVSFIPMFGGQLRSFQLMGIGTMCRFLMILAALCGFTLSN
ncbi:unnamed protein product, partial [Citrullus colocynthis]